MTNDSDPRGDRTRPRVDATQCERLIHQACSSEKRSAAAHQTPVAASEPTTTQGNRESLTQAMIGLILGPDAF
jgi:hypothetical protein